MAFLQQTKAMHWGYFDGMVSSGQLPELVKRANELDSEIKDLDGDMQMLVYEHLGEACDLRGMVLDVLMIGRQWQVRWLLVWKLVLVYEL